MALAHDNAAHPHAATSTSTGERYTYDANGNMTLRTLGSDYWTITWDADNKMSSLYVWTGGVNLTDATNFFRDADGSLVLAGAHNADTPGWIVHVGNYFEYDTSTGTTTTYYNLGGRTVAMRQGSSLYYLQGDHLGSTSLTTDGSGNEVGLSRYWPWGGTVVVTGTIPTDRLFTGQRKEPVTGVYDYGARFYYSVTGQFMSPDSIVPQPGNPQSLNRYAYSLNNPVKYSDPTGHCPQPPANIGSGNIICIAGFIPTEISEAFFRQFQGDNRGFTPFGTTDENSRVWAWIDIDTGRIIDPVSGKPTDKGIFHPTVTADGKESWDPLPSNQFTSEKDKNGNIVVKYSFRCSDQGPSCVAGPVGRITFKPNQFGSFDTEGDVTAFPNLEAYHWKDGQLLICTPFGGHPDKGYYEPWNEPDETTLHA